MSLHLGLLTMQACFGPLTLITIDTWPNMAGGNQMLCGTNIYWDETVGVKDQAHSDEIV